METATPERRAALYDADIAALAACLPPRREMKPRHRLLAPPPRFFPGQRWVNIALRGLHLVGVAGIGGGFLFDLAEARWLPYWHLTLASGVMLAALYVWTDPAWLIQLKGQAILAKLALLALAELYPPWRAGLFLSVIVLSAFFAHAPDRVRSHIWGRRARPSRGGDRLE